MTRAVKTQSPEFIGEAFAADIWGRRGRSVVLHAKAYGTAVAELAKQCGDPLARQAFDRHLAQIAADASCIIRPKLPQR